MRPLLVALVVLAAPARAQEEAAAARAREEADLLRSAQRHFEAKNHAAAARALEQVLATRTGDAAARALLGHCYFEMGRLEKAQSQFTRAVGLGRLTSDVVIRLAHIARAQGEPAAALNALRLAHMLAPRDAAVLSAAGDAAAAAGLREEAESAFRAAVDLDPARADAYLRLANVHLGRGASALALAAFVTAHHLGAGSAKLSRVIAELHVECGQLLRGVGWYERLLLAKPEDEGKLRLRCAQLLAAGGDRDRARDHAAKLTASRDEAVACGAHLLLGRLAGRAGHKRAAVEHWRRALALGHAGPEISGVLGAHFHQAGEHALAVKHLQKRLREGPRDPHLARALVRSLLALGELDTARLELVRSVEQFGLDDQAERLIANLARAAAKKGR